MVRARTHVVDFALERRFPYYVDHAAGKGILHLTERTGRDQLRSDGQLAARPQSLADPDTWDRLVRELRANLSTTRRGPIMAAAFDDEISLGVFTSPHEVDSSPASLVLYRQWLRSQYGTIEQLNRHGARSMRPSRTSNPYRSATSAHSTSVRRSPAGIWPPGWTGDPSWTGSWPTFGGLTRVANDVAPGVPAGFVGAQQPSAYGGYDYDRLRDSLQWIEAYDIGGTNEILRSFWSGPQPRPRVQTFFSTGDARQDAWFLWYYLLHGNRGVIAWPDRDGHGWFENGRLAPYLEENRATFREVQGDLSRQLLAQDIQSDPDPIAVLYSHASIQASWATDVVTHGKTWPRRSASLDNTCQSAGKNREAWFKLLEDCGYQYDVLSGREITGDALCAASRSGIDPESRPRTFRPGVPGDRVVCARRRHGRGGLLDRAAR